MLASFSNALQDITKKLDLECKIPKQLPEVQSQTLDDIENLLSLFHNLVETANCINTNLENNPPQSLKSIAKQLAVINNPNILSEISLELTHKMTFDQFATSKDAEKIDQLYTKYPKATYIYVQIMKKIIDILFKKDIKEMAATMELVEKRKTAILFEACRLKPEIKRENNPMLSRFSLVPATGMMTVKDILDKAAIELEIKTGSKSFSELAKSSDCGVVILYKIISTPVELRSHQLLYPNEPTPPQQESHPGISKALVQKYNTIVELPLPKKSASKWDFSGEVIHNKSTKRYLVVETIDKINYRILAPWINARAGGIILGKFRVEKLIEAIEDPKNQPSRSTLYTRNLCHAFAKNMFLKKPIELDAYGKFTDLPSHKLFQSVSEKLIARLTKNWGRSKKLTKLELNDAFHDTEYAEIFKKEVMAKHTEICSDDVLQSSEIVFGEIFTSFLVEMDRSATKLMKELHDAYLKLPEEIDKAFCEELFLKILGMTLKPHDNIYAALEYKNYLFQMTSLTNIKKKKAKEQASDFFEL